MNDAQQHRLIAYGFCVLLGLLAAWRTTDLALGVLLTVLCLFAYELQELHERDQRRKRGE